MKIKINRYEFDATNKDYIMDNGRCYQCLTLKHTFNPHRTGRYAQVTREVYTHMPNNQFNELLKKNQLVFMSREQYPETYARYVGNNIRIKLYRFNFEEQGENK